jgi:hypothetical protein
MSLWCDDDGGSRMATITKAHESAHDAPCEAPSKKARVLFAKDALAGDLYLSGKSKNVVRMERVEKDKVILAVYVRFYGWQELTVTANHLLTEMSKSEQEAIMKEKKSVKVNEGKKVKQVGTGRTINFEGLKPGAVLKKEHKGKSYEIAVTQDGFVYEKQCYTSLSKIGALILGNKTCNGPAFFGLREKAKKDESKVAKAAK